MNQPMGIAEIVKDLAINSENWRHQQSIASAYKSFDLINKFVYNEELPQAIIGHDDSGRMQRMSKYHYEGDGVALPHHIDLKIGLSFEQTLIGLLIAIEEMRSEVFDKKDNWYYSLDWQKRMKKMGLVCSSSGQVEKINLPFRHVLTKFMQVTGLPDEDKKDMLKQFIEEFKKAQTATEEPEVLSDDNDTDVISDVDGVVLSPATKKAKKTRKYACNCEKGDPNGSTTFWAVRIAPGTICGACNGEFLPVNG